jgi:hypothetical protein
MKQAFSVSLFTIIFLLSATSLHGAPKPHVIAFGRIITVKWIVGSDETEALDLKVRRLFVDTRLKEYTTGLPHEVTDRLFVVRRVFRLNDSLPGEPATPAAVAVAARWLAPGGPGDGEGFADQSSRI